MPYSLRRSGSGYFVITKGTNKKHSKRPLSRRMAGRQMRALYASMRRSMGRSEVRQPKMRRQASPGRTPKVL
jgi:hypothetical protein